MNGIPRIVAVDWGRRRTGLAVSSPDGTYALGLAPHIGPPDARVLAERIRAERPDRVVVGLPLRMDGTEGDTAAEVRAFADALEHELGVPVELWDERLTSEAARGMIRGVPLSRRKKRVLVNTVSAQVILQSYLDAHRQRT
jgi:putative Holliday junction resolvase